MKSNLFTLKLLKNKSFNLILAVICLNIPSIMAQKTVTVNEYLISTKDAYQVKSDADRIAFLNEYNHNLPLIKGAQLRSETKDFLVNKQECSLRVSPNSLSAISHQKKIYRSKIEKVKIKNQRNFNKELKKRYLLLIDYIFTKDLIELYEEKHIQIKDKLTILGQSIYNIDFDVNDLIDTEEELIAIELKLANLKDDQFNQLYLIRQFLNFHGGSLNFDLKDLIQPAQIIKNSSTNFTKNEHLSIRLQKVKLNTLENEMLLNSAKSNQIIDYFQVKYNGSKNFVFEENFSAGIGINLPFFAGTRRKKGKYYFDKLSEESKLVTIKRDVEDEQKLIFNEFKTSITNYQTLKQQIVESNVNSIIDYYGNMEGVSPILILKLNILQNKKKTEVLKAKHDLFKTYIRTLDIQETLYKQPLRNYLSSDMRLLLP